MADVHDTATRSYNMSRIRSKNTKPEIEVRKFLFSKGYRYRLYDKNLPGKPDIVFPKYRTVIFVNGCFWHGHDNCKYYVIPKTNTEWWLNKINRTKELDLIHRKELEANKWKVITIFECALKDGKTHTTFNDIEKQLIENVNANTNY